MSALSPNNFPVEGRKIILLITFPVVVGNVKKAGSRGDMSPGQISEHFLIPMKLDPADGTAGDNGSQHLLPGPGMR